ncbi:restriction endonuclease subunit S, partial [Holdemanella sp.]|uniref:restriction endonuclease subunit S n=1 Tax=Holdemanella sp. TaxID=1971762 RepID=UPI003AF12F9A
FKKDDEWDNKKLGDCLLQSPDYGLNSPAVPYSPLLPTYLRITDISENGRFISKTKVSVDATITDENSLHDGDIVLARTGASVGKSYKYRKEDGDLVFAGFLIRIRPNTTKYNSEFIFQYLQTDIYKKWVNITSARSGQPGINSNEYSSLSIPSPSPDEQQKIAECLSSIDELIGLYENKVTLLEQHKKGLIQQLFPKL